ncbi:MAG: hypothetical protein ACRER2_07125 [Methylococcales bacterium]
MPQYHRINEFMAHVRRANSTFERWDRSDLRPLIDILNDDTGNFRQVHEALIQLRPVKVAKYRDAIWYLQATYPGLVYTMLPMGALGKTNAAQYTRTPLSSNYNPSTRTRPPRRNQPPLSMAQSDRRAVAAHRARNERHYAHPSVRTPGEYE